MQTSNVDQSCCLLFKKQIKHLQFKFIVMCLLRTDITAFVNYCFVNRMFYVNEIVLKAIISRG